MERTLTTLPSENETQRTTLVEVSTDGNVYVEVRSESLIESLGWVVQKRIALDSHAVKNMRCALNLFLGDTRCVSREDNVVSLDVFKNRRKAS